MFWRKKKKPSKAGKVYILESTRKDGSKKLYTGQTKRSVYQRVGEHMKATKSKSNKSWTGRGTGVRLLGAVYSTNRHKAERTIKKMSPTRKRALAKSGARKYKKRR